MISASFLKQCIAEVLIESDAALHSNPKQDKARAFVKECIAEVIIEPHRSLTVHGNPKRLMTAHLIKECVMEVLKENLTEGFDPLSDAGPNPTQENPYPEWNSKMRQLEETEKQSGAVYKVRQNGQWVYWMNNFDGAGKIPLRPESVKKYIRQGYRLVNLEPSAPVAEEHPHGRYAQEAGATPLMSTFTEIRNKYDPDGTKHDLTLKCVKCGTTQTCRCSKPKRTMEGICDKCAQKQKALNEIAIQHPLQSTAIKWKCPHCYGVTKILIEIESPSDYISCSECDHCKKEISDPHLDTRIYEEVISCYSGQGLKKKVCEGKSSKGKIIFHSKYKTHDIYWVTNEGASLYLNEDDVTKYKKDGYQIEKTIDIK